VFLHRDFFLAASFANTIHHHVDLFHGIAFGQLYLGNGYLIETNGFATSITFEVNMVVMMMSRYNAGFVAQGITGNIVRGGNVVNDPFLQKSLQCSVNRYPVVFIRALQLNILMGQSVFGRKKNFEDSLSTRCYTECAIF
jgi:hypothetical protein